MGLLTIWDEDLQERVKKPVDTKNGGSQGFKMAYNARRIPSAPPQLTALMESVGREWEE
jgi:hypothetical protein